MNITIEIPSKRYSFDKKHWKLFDSEEIYFRNLSGNNIYIYCPELIIPSIKADIKNSKPLRLDIDGKYLVADFGRIEQIGQMLQYSNAYVPKLSFSCDRFKLMTIRYHADYLVRQGILFRECAPPGTYGKIIAANHEPIVFDDCAEIPYVFGDVIPIEECYDDGLSGELSIKVAEIDRRFRICYDKGLILNGNIIKKFSYECGGNKYSYSNNPFYPIYGIDGSEITKDAYMMEMEAMSPLGKIAYPYLLEQIKEMLFQDMDATRVVKRMERVSKIDPYLAMEMGDRFLKNGVSAKVSDYLEVLKRKYIK